MRRRVISLLFTFGLFVSAAVADNQKKAPSASQAAIPNARPHIVVRNLPQISSASLGEKPSPGVLRMLPGQKFRIRGKNFVAPGIDTAPPSSSSAIPDGGNKFGTAKIKVYVLSQVLNYSGTLGASPGKGLPPTYKVAAAMVPLEGGPTEIVVQMSPKVQPGLYLLQVEVHGKDRSNLLPVEVVTMQGDFSPRILDFGPHEATAGTTINVNGIRLPEPGVVLLEPVQASPGKTLTVALKVNEPACGGGAWGFPVVCVPSPRTFTVPPAAIEGKYRIQAASPDLKVKTKSVDFTVIPELEVYGISYVGFKAIETTSGPGTDEPYMVAVIFDTVFNEWNTAWGQVFEGIEPGKSMSETVRLFTGTPDANRYIIVAGMGECDNYYTDYSGVGPLSPLPVQRWIDHEMGIDTPGPTSITEPVTINNWGRYQLLDVEGALFCAFRDHDGAGCDLFPDLRNASRAESVKFIKDQLRAALKSNGDELGVFEVQYDASDLKQARLSHGADAVIKTADFKGDGSYYKVNFHLRVLKKK